MNDLWSSGEMTEKMKEQLIPIFQRSVQKLVDVKREQLNSIFGSSIYDYKTVDEELKTAKNKLSKLVDKRRKQKTKSKEVENVNSKTLVNEKKKSEPFFRL